MKKAERIAKLVVEAILPGAEMHLYEDQSGGRHDFDLCLPSGEMAALEVTTSTNEQLRSTIAAICDPRRGGHFVPTRRCQKDWSVHLRPGASIKKIRSCVDQYLADVEAAGLQRFIAPTDCARYPAVDQIYRDLAIEAGEVTVWKQPGQIGIWLPDGGEFTGEHVQSAVRAEAFKGDNRTKLGKTGCCERHLFVYVDPWNYPTWKSLLDEHAPAEPPELPNEISHVWVVSETRDPGRLVVWRGGADVGWSETHDTGDTLRDSLHPKDR